MINNQATEIHHRVIKKIMEMMTVDETEARVVKAAIYRHIKDNHPELSNLDRALEMEKNTTKEFIDTLDIEKTRSDMKKHYAEKDKMKAEKKAASSSDSASTPTEKPAKKVAAKKASAKTTVAKKTTKKAAAKSEVSASESAYTPESASSEYLSELDQMITLDSPTSMIEYTE